MNGEETLLFQQKVSEMFPDAGEITVNIGFNQRLMYGAMVYGSSCPYCHTRREIIASCHTALTMEDALESLAKQKSCQNV